MNLLNEVYQKILGAGLVKSHRQFSEKYAGLNPNWMSYQNHNNRGFSATSAINCLQNVRGQAANESLLPEQKASLSEVDVLLSKFIKEEFSKFGVDVNVSEITPTDKFLYFKR